MRIKVNVRETVLSGTYSNSIPGVIVACTKCGKEESIYGTGERSIRKACINLREKCTEGPIHFYSDRDETSTLVARSAGVDEDCERLFWIARNLLHRFESMEEIRASSDRKFAIGLLKRGLGCSCERTPVDMCPAHCRVPNEPRL